MTQYVKSEFGTELALSILTEIQYQRYNYYSFLGKCDPWPGADTVPSISQNNSSFDYKQIRNNMVYLKRITPNDTSMVISRINWSMSFPQIYDQWDDTEEMQGKDFYCVTDEWDVYKCLNNNYGAISTNKPVGKDLDPIEFSVLSGGDGYIWKYMYSIPSFKQNKFVTSRYMPVQLALTDSFYNKGSVENIVIQDAGSGYTSEQLTVINVSAPEIGGTFAVLIPSVSTEDLLDLNGNIIRYAGAITNVIIKDAGTGYLTPPTLSVNNSASGITGTGVYGNTSAKLTAVVFDGKIVNVTIEDPGKDYLADASSYITVIGDGKYAKFTPVIYLGELIDVITENVGIGYNIMSLQVNGSGTGAKIVPILGVSDYISEQAVVEQVAESQAGSIYSSIIINGGSNYTNNTLVSSNGDGTGFHATALIVSGAVTKINILDFGQNYTYINISVVDQSNGTNNAIIRAIFPPIGGHGKNAISELNSNTVVINSFIQKDLLLNKFNQDYRRVGLLKNPLKRVTNTTFRDSIANMCFEVILDDSHIDHPLITEIVGADSEDILTLNSSRFRVISLDVNNVLLLQLDNKYTQPLGDMVCERTGITYKSLQLVSVPLIDRFSGKLLYVSDEDPFTFIDNQGLNIKTFLEF